MRLSPLAFLAAMLGLALAGLPAPSTSKKTAAGKNAPKTSASRKFSSKKSAANSAKSKKKSSSKSAKGKKSRVQARSWRNSQRTPTPERYREIQQALIDRGYLQGPASGMWGPESIEALKRFQRDQNLNADGKLDSLSLIAMGLGPKRAAIAQPRTQP